MSRSYIAKALREEVAADARHLLAFRADEYLKPRVTLHDRVEDSLLVRVFQQKESYLHRPSRLAPLPIHTPLALLHFRRIPFRVVMQHVPRVVLQIDSLLAHATDQKHEGRIRSIKVFAPYVFVFFVLLPVETGRAIEARQHLSRPFDLTPSLLLVVFDECIAHFWRIVQKLVHNSLHRTT